MKFLISPFLFILIQLLNVHVYAQQTSLKKNMFNIENGIALQGYDAVAYFTQKKAVKGSSNFTFAYKNITYRFYSQQHLESFKKSPAAYEAQYGGWCAYAMGKTGDKVEVDPETFKIIDGKLYLYYHTLFKNTLSLWNEQESTLKALADKNWKKYESN